MLLRKIHLFLGRNPIRMGREAKTHHTICSDNLGVFGRDIPKCEIRLRLPLLANYASNGHMQLDRDDTAIPPSLAPSGFNSSSTSDGRIQHANDQMRQKRNKSYLIDPLPSGASTSSAPSVSGGTIPQQVSGASTRRPVILRVTAIASAHPLELTVGDVPPSLDSRRAIDLVVHPDYPTGATLDQYYPRFLGRHGIAIRHQVAPD